MLNKNQRNFGFYITVAFLLIAILTGLGGPVPPVKAQDFTMPTLPPPPEEAFLPRLSVPLDVAALPEGEIKQAIVDLLAMKIVEPYADGLFRPYKASTRADFAVALDKTLHLPPAPQDLKIKDLKKSYWAKESIRRTAVYLPLYPDGSFRPSAPATREDVAVALVLATGLEKTAADPGNLDLMFEDAAGVSPKLKQLVGIAVAEKLIKPYAIENKLYLRAQGYVTRAEMSYLLREAMGKVALGYKKSPEPEEEEEAT